MKKNGMNEEKLKFMSRQYKLKIVKVNQLEL